MHLLMEISPTFSPFLSTDIHLRFLHQKLIKNDSLNIVKCNYIMIKTSRIQSNQSCNLTIRFSTCKNEHTLHHIYEKPATLAWEKVSYNLKDWRVNCSCLEISCQAKLELDISYFLHVMNNIPSWLINSYSK